VLEQFAGIRGLEDSIIALPYLNPVIVGQEAEVAHLEPSLNTVMISLLVPVMIRSLMYTPTISRPRLPLRVTAPLETKRQQHVVELGILGPQRLEKSVQGFAEMKNLVLVVRLTKLGGCLT
jgi:hypothetical protein